MFFGWLQINPWNTTILISDTTSFNRVNNNTIRYEEKNAACMTDPTKHGRRVDLSKARYLSTPGPDKIDSASILWRSLKWEQQQSADCTVEDWEVKIDNESKIWDFLQASACACKALYFTSIELVSYDYSDYGSDVNLFELHCHWVIEKRWSCSKMPISLFNKWPIPLALSCHVSSTLL